MVVAVIAVVVAYQKLSPQMFDLLVAGLLLVAALVILLALYLHFRRSIRERQKLQALSMVDIHVMGGLDFEKYVAELLKSQGYTNVALTEKYDYGVDVVAVRDGVRWGIQVKRHADMVKADAVRQVVTALNHCKCQRAMVVTDNIFSRPAKSLAASNSCVLVDRGKLADWMVEFQG